MTKMGYFIRWKGVVTGPFSLEQLQTMVKTNQLSKYHEISADRQQWVLAGQITDLFPRKPKHTETYEPEEHEEHESEETGQDDEQEEGDEDKWYYMVGDKKVGPVDIATLKRLVRMGSLRKDDIVWKEGSNRGQLACSIPELVSDFHRGKQLLEIISGAQGKETGIRFSLAGLVIVLGLIILGICSGRAVIKIVYSTFGVLIALGILTLGVLGIVSSQKVLSGGIDSSSNRKDRGPAIASLVIGIIDIVFGAIMFSFLYSVEVLRNIFIEGFGEVFRRGGF